MNLQDWQNIEFKTAQPRRDLPEPSHERPSFEQYWKEHADEARRYRRNRIILAIVFSGMIIAGIALKDRDAELGAILIWMGGALLLLVICAAIQWLGGGPDPESLKNSGDFDVDVGSFRSSSHSFSHSSGGFGRSSGGGGRSSGGSAGRGR